VPTVADITKLIDQANIAFFRGDRDGAIKLCQQVLKVDTTNYDAHRITGDIYADQGRRTEAIAAYLEALRVQPNNRQLHDKLRLLQAPPVATPTTRPTAGSATVPLGNGTSGKSQERPSLFRRFIGGSK
jgi:tetratricopeptide (TPR) repeat protein